MSEFRFEIKNSKYGIIVYSENKEKAINVISENFKHNLQNIILIE